MYEKSDGKEIELIRFFRIETIRLDKSATKRIRKALSNNRKNVFLKVEYKNSDGEKVEYDLEVFTRGIKKTKIQANKFSNLINDYNSDIFLARKSENVEPGEIDKTISVKMVDKINLDFLFNLSNDELSNCLNNKTIIMNNGDYHMKYNKFDRALTIFNKENMIIILFSYKKIFIYPESFYVYIDKNYNVDFDDLKSSQFILFKEIITNLKQICR